MSQAGSTKVYQPPMRYIVYHRGYSFTTNNYDYANHYAPGMIVFDLWNWKFTDDGFKWQEIEEDHL